MNQGEGRGSPINVNGTVHPQTTVPSNAIQEQNEMGQDSKVQPLPFKSMRSCIYKQHCRKNVRVSSHTHTRAPAPMSFFFCSPVTFPHKPPSLSFYCRTLSHTLEIVFQWRSRVQSGGEGGEEGEGRRRRGGEGGEETEGDEEGEGRRGKGRRMRRGKEGHK